MRTFLLLFLCSLLVIVSCKKDSNDTASADFMEITMNGKTYSNDSNYMGSGFGGLGGCDIKTYKMTTVGQINLPTLFLIVYIKYYGNGIDFKTSKPGTYGVIALAGYDVSALENGCNFSLGIGYADKQQFNVVTTILPGSIHKVTNIKEVERTKTEIVYSVSGTFSCSCKNSQGQTIPLTGKYQTEISALK